MNRTGIIILTAALMSFGSTTAFAGTPAQPYAQVSKDRSDIKTASTKIIEDEKEVNRLNDLFNQARVKAYNAHTAYTKKSAAREAAYKSYGGKDARSQQAAKEEGAAKQEWLADLKEEQTLGAQRKAAIDKKDADVAARGGDVRKLESDEGKAGSKPATAPK